MPTCPDNPDHDIFVVDGTVHQRWAVNQDNDLLHVVADCLDVVSEDLVVCSYCGEEIRNG